MECKNCPYYVYDYDEDFDMVRWHCIAENDYAPCNREEE